MWEAFRTLTREYGAMPVVFISGLIGYIFWMGLKAVWATRTNK
jgi:hypothetical protein